jgi:hypothetical protein
MFISPPTPSWNVASDDFGRHALFLSVIIDVIPPVIMI